MDLKDLILDMMDKLDFTEIKNKDYECGYDFRTTLEHYYYVIYDEIKIKSEYFENNVFAITNKNIDLIIKETQKKIDNDPTYE